jgi:hypothetical protein
MRLEDLQRTIEIARATSSSSQVEQEANDVRLLGEIARRLMPMLEHKEDPDFMSVMHKQAEIANLLVAVRERLAT